MKRNKWEYYQNQTPGNTIHELYNIKVEYDIEEIRTFAWNCNVKKIGYQSFDVPMWHTP